MAPAIDTSVTEDDRLDELDRYAVLVDPPGEDLQELVELVAHLCDVPRAAINIISRTEQHGIVTTGLDPMVCAREDSMCAIVLHDPRTVVVSDASDDSRFSSNAFVDGRIGTVRFYASARQPQRCHHRPTLRLRRRAARPHPTPGALGTHARPPGHGRARAAPARTRAGGVDARAHPRAR
jgi:hypothetical protein